MSERILSVSTYGSVLTALLLLTFLTVGVSFVPLAGHWHVAAGLAIAAVKGGLVVLFFMHALQSPKLTWAVIAMALFWLLILVGLTLSDYVTRGLTPGMPGH
ncbi:MAG TPA: cytochrome C oxidase subunit IV family protein [Pirellulales bacterium]|jgi:cytochrome c oxidase subunit 4|nr:cytochrome C oxidase subunit IV family protein [Pirellulales bacterium]